jgi:DNA-binding IclR family transcriptional regulator
MAAQAPRGGRSVTGRALAVLAAFDGDHPRLSLSDIARRTGTPLSTTFRLVAELEQWRALDRDADGRYTIGFRLWELGRLAPVNGGIREAAMPFMSDLYELTRENVHLAVRDGDEAIYVEKLTGHRAVPILSRVGGRLPLHATGVGKALLAAAPVAFRAAYLRRSLVRVTPYTLTDPQRLARELDLVRRRGWARTSEEMSLGSCSVAVTVPGSGAALGIVVHSVRRDLDKWVPALQRAAEGVARRVASFDVETLAVAR